MNIVLKYGNVNSCIDKIILYYLNIYAHKYTHVYIHTHTYIYIYIYIYLYLYL